MLTALQQRLAAVVADLPEAEGFALAGAGALLVHGLIDRPTLDLDFFGPPLAEARVQDLAAAIERAVVAGGMESIRQRDLPSFVRLEVSDGDQQCEIDLAVDYRARDLQMSPYGPTLAVEELAANKVLAVFDRAEPRDFRDLAAVMQRFSLERLCELAYEKDAGFDLSHFREALRSFRRFSSEELGLNDDQHRRLSGLVEQWTVLVERIQKRDRAVGRKDPGLSP